MTSVSNASVQKFLSAHPECDPDEDSYIGSYSGDCGADSANGRDCAMASNWGGASSAKSCKDTVTNQIQEIINGKTDPNTGQRTLGLKQCQSRVLSSFVSQSISELQSSESTLQTALVQQQASFDATLNLMEAQVQSDIDIENLVSGSILILAFVIITYLLFSKIFV